MDMGEGKLRLLNELDKVLGTIFGRLGRELGRFDSVLGIEVGRFGRVGGMCRSGVIGELTRGGTERFVRDGLLRGELRPFAPLSANEQFTSNTGKVLRAKGAPGNEGLLNGECT